jgi:3-hydroxyisobutyrate dehydrogenase
MTAPGLLRVGVVGCGQMGGAIAESLLRCFRVLVCDINPAAVAPLELLGAVACPDPAALAADCDTVVVCVRDDSQAARVIAGDWGLLEKLRPGTVVINATTGSAFAAAGLAASCAAARVHYLTAPVSQGVAAARHGRLSTFVYGTAEAVDAARPVLAAYCADIILLSSHQAAAAAKLVTNDLWFIYAAGLAEALVLLAKAGVGRGDMGRVLNSSCGRSWVTEHDLDSVLTRGDYDQTFTLELCQKDLGLVAELAALLGVQPEMGRAAAAVFGRALRAYGPGGPELAVVALAERDAGVQLGAGHAARPA